MSRNNILVHYGILGMKWGVRRYQNKDGTLTPEGKKRYDRDIQENLSKKKDSRIDTSKPDPSRWVKEDLKRANEVVKSAAKLTENIKQIESNYYSPPKKQRMDLSNKTDAELRSEIEREVLERRYNELFAKTDPENISKGRKYVHAILEGGATLLGVAGSVLGIALSIKELKG